MILGSSHAVYYLRIHGSRWLWNIGRSWRFWVEGELKILQILCVEKVAWLGTEDDGTVSPGPGACDSHVEVQTLRLMFEILCPFLLLLFGVCGFQGAHFHLLDLNPQVCLCWVWVLWPRILFPMHLDIKTAEMEDGNQGTTLLGIGFCFKSCFPKHGLCTGFWFFFLFFFGFFCFFLVLLLFSCGLSESAEWGPLPRNQFSMSQPLRMLGIFSPSCSSMLLLPSLI